MSIHLLCFILHSPVPLKFTKSKATIPSSTTTTKWTLSLKEKKNILTVSWTGMNLLDLYSSVTEGFLGLRTRSLTEAVTSWSSFRISSAPSSSSWLSIVSSSPCPIFLFWLINCFTTNPWYLTRRECWSWGKEWNGYGYEKTVQLN